MLYGLELEYGTSSPNVPVKSRARRQINAEPNSKEKTQVLAKTKQKKKKRTKTLKKGKRARKEKEILHIVFLILSYIVTELFNTIEASILNFEENSFPTQQLPGLFRNGTMDFNGATRAQTLSSLFKPRETKSTTKRETKREENFFHMDLGALKTCGMFWFEIAS